MSVRVVARIRPLLAKELDEDVIVHAASAEPGRPTTVVRIPNPRNEGEEFSFSFNGVYDHSTSQETLFTSEVAPHLKALFQGIDVTLFAYGATGTGKTHTMRGGLKLADRGVIPRLLSGIFRRGKKLMRETEGNTRVQVALSYYEIYNDKVFDLLESHEKRPPAGLPLRAEANGKTVVVGLEERLCSDLKDFEKLYIEANNNRATAATKLNSHSSRSHAILRVKVTQTTGDEIRESTASAIDLAGSEDNRRTDNDKERLVESAAINKSLFVLSQCIDAISRGDKRIPYRESKMTRILSLGQNDGITVMILNLSPLRCSHLDTLSSLNISSRAKRIEAREIENEVVFKQGPRANSNAVGAMMQRQPLRPLANAINVVPSANAPAKDAEAAKPIKAFSVFSDRSSRPRAVSRSTITPHARTLKRRSESGPPSRPSKQARSTGPDRASLQTPLARIQQDDGSSITVSASEIEAMVERKVNEILAARNAAQGSARGSERKNSSGSDSIKRRLKALERRIENEEGRDDSRSEGLRHLLAARQAKEKGDEAAALSAYEKALPYFPNQPKLLGKIERLQARQGITSSKESSGRTGDPDSASAKAEKRRGRKMTAHQDEEIEVHDDTFAFLGKSTGRTKHKSKPESKTRDRARSDSKSKSRSRSRTKSGTAVALEKSPKTPRTRHLLDVINSGDTAEIRKLVGFGAKKAHDLARHVELLHAGGGAGIESLSQLRSVPGLGGKSVDRAYAGLCPPA